MAPGGEGRDVLRSCLVTFALAWTVGAAAGAAAADPPTRLHGPTPDQRAAAFPRNPLAAHGGHSTLQCMVTAEGRLRDCRVTEEAPSGAGFGAAALSLAPAFSFEPASPGHLTETPVTLPFTWAVPSLVAQRLALRVPWAEAPSFADLAAAFPAGARAAHMAGEANLFCTIGSDRRLHGCRVVSETPQGQGFGDAARSLTRRFRAPPDQPGAETLVGAHTQIRFAFPVEAAGAAPPTITQPQWTQQQGGSAGSGYPRAAVNAHVYDGRVMLTCVVVAGGRLDRCAALSEDPPGLGFAHAAIALTPGFVMTLWTDDDLPTVGATVNVPVHYHLPPP
jgi:TonB family protein